jgi:hypothetical protein
MVAVRCALLEERGQSAHSFISLFGVTLNGVYAGGISTAFTMTFARGNIGTTVEKGEGEEG